MHIRPATPADAPDLADLVDLAGEGLPSHLWAAMAEAGQSARDVGLARAARDKGAFSWRNAWIAEVDGQAAACLVAYTLPETPDPVDPAMPAIVVPLQELENAAPGTRYVNVLAAKAGHRGRGVGGRLLSFAEADAGPRGMSLVVSNANAGARRLYERHGYRVADRRAMLKQDGWDCPGTEWLLMVKPADQLRNG